MGHCITADIDETSTAGHVAWYERGAFNSEEVKTQLYRALNAMECYGGCSGNGGQVKRDYFQISEALTKAEVEDMEENVIIFLNQCLNVFSSRITEIYIHFG